MTEEQKNRMHPGAYKSCLIPYAEAIFTWWYDEQLPATEIQRRLKNTGMTVSLSTITRFIKVRERLAARRQKPENLPVAPGQILIVKSAGSKDVKQTAKNTLEVEKTPDSVATYNNSEKEIMEDPEKRDVAEAEAMIQKLLNSTPQQLGLEEEEARKRMKQKQK